MWHLEFIFWHQPATVDVFTISTVLACDSPDRSWRRAWTSTKQQFHADLSQGCTAVCTKRCFHKQPIWIYLATISLSLLYFLSLTMKSLPLSSSWVPFKGAVSCSQISSQPLTEQAQTHHSFQWKESSFHCCIGGYLTDSSSCKCGSLNLKLTWSLKYEKKTVR